MNIASPSQLRARAAFARSVEKLAALQDKQYYLQRTEELGVEMRSREHAMDLLEEGEMPTSLYMPSVTSRLCLERNPLPESDLTWSNTIACSLGIVVSFDCNSAVLAIR